MLCERVDRFDLALACVPVCLPLSYLEEAGVAKNNFT